MKLSHSQVNSGHISAGSHRNSFFPFAWIFSCSSFNMEVQREPGRIFSAAQRLTVAEILYCMLHSCVSHHHDLFLVRGEDGRGSCEGMLTFIFFPIDSLQQGGGEREVRHKHCAIRSVVLCYLDKCFTLIFGHLPPHCENTL